MRRFDLGRTLALAWIATAVGLTVVLGPRLGLRGWAWLLVHHLACAVGAGHELVRARRRQRQARQTVTTSRGSSAKVHGA